MLAPSLGVPALGQGQEAPPTHEFASGQPSSQLARPYGDEAIQVGFSELNQSLTANWQRDGSQQRAEETEKCDVEGGAKLAEFLNQTFQRVDSLGQAAANLSRQDLMLEAIATLE